MPKDTQAVFCRICEGPVNLQPGHYLVTFAAGSGPRHGQVTYFCEQCALETM